MTQQIHCPYQPKRFLPGNVYGWLARKIWPTREQGMNSRLPPHIHVWGEEKFHIHDIRNVTTRIYNQDSYEKHDIKFENIQQFIGEFPRTVLCITSCKLPNEYSMITSSSTQNEWIIYEQIV